MHRDQAEAGASFKVTPAKDAPGMLVVCEHASAHIPAEYHGLGLSEEAAQSHAAWDPGALPVARALAADLGAVLVEGTVSRLVYDCNRPPEAASAIPVRSEVFDIPGNAGLTAAARARRIDTVYTPFTEALAAQVARHRNTLQVMVTVHSFTPVYNDVPREVEIGILHGADADFAQAMMQLAPQDGRHIIRLNEPYAASDGVAHTLDRHGADNGLPSVMIEIRNDLLTTADAQQDMAQYLAGWLRRTLAAFPRQEGAA